MGRTITITKIFCFEAGHHLPGHAGPCARRHGHSYRLEVTVAGTPQAQGSSAGMIMDFADLKAVVDKHVISAWDHQYLNDILPFQTTVENLAAEAFARLEAAGLPLCRVRLWETATCYAEVIAQ